MKEDSDAESFSDSRSAYALAAYQKADGQILQFKRWYVKLT